MKKLIYNGLIFSLFITITLVAVSCAFNSSYFVGEGMEQGNKDFRESFIKVENKFSARGCKDDKCTIERVISSALEKQAMMVRRMITRSKSYKDIKDIRND